MDMAKHLRRWLNEKTLREMGDYGYQGRIADVTEEKLRNRYTAQQQLQPVITFEDGWLLVPNLRRPVTTDTWAATVRAEVVRIARVRTTRWLHGREADNPSPRPMVFDGTARLIHRGGAPSKA